MEIDDSGWSRIEEARNGIFPSHTFLSKPQNPAITTGQIPVAITDPRGPSWSRNNPRGDPRRTSGQARDGPVTSPCCLTGPPPCRVFADNSSNLIVGERRPRQSARLPVASIAPPL